MKVNYLIEVSTKGRETESVAIRPKSELLITIDRKEEEIELYTNVKYTISVFKSKVKTMNEFVARRMDAGITGPILKTIGFKPHKEATSIKIKLYNTDFLQIGRFLF
ncbi:hypothetical protein [Radiobacillus deserti]|uniref:Uncharacterized protein n=1 Tax=Radiobacillus deserti TaxID=2594883 RepID=A0A516KHF3_9BACI|nr:hypothetical protein [Radiobacillus deserti]QDP40786.1 hypothetical protein FN924_11675 [Radiobacillus deserti]